MGYTGENDRRAPAKAAFTEQQLKDLIDNAALAAADAIESRRGEKCPGCILDDEIHKAQHRAVDEFIKTLGRFNKLKWGVAQAVVIFVVLGVLGVAGFKKLGGG